MSRVIDGWARVEAPGRQASSASPVFWRAI
jgi:hypothetical protein